MSTKKKPFIAILGVEGVIIAVFIILILYFSSNTVKVNRRMEFAQRYLLQEDYERAIAAFEIIIEMDSENVEAYIGIAQAYAETGALEKTVELLEEGIRRVKKSDSDEIQAMLDLYTEELALRETLQKDDLMMADASQQQEPIEGTADSSPQPEEAVTVNTGFITQDGDLYHYNELGNPVVGWFEVEGSRYYAGADGRLYRNGEHEVDSVKYLFGQEGICVEEIKDDGWKQAYIDYLQQEHQVFLKDGGYEGYLSGMYDLIYINDDDIPELAGSYPSAGARGDYSISYYSNGIVKSAPLGGGSSEFSYIERKNLIYILHDGYYTYEGYGTLYEENEIFAKFINGEIAEVAEASIRWKDLQNNPNDCIYFWDGIEVSEENFKGRYQNMSFNKEEILWASGTYTYEQILDVIRNY